MQLHENIHVACMLMVNKNIGSYSSYKIKGSLQKDWLFFLKRFPVMTVLPRRFACNLFLLEEFILVARILILLTRIAFYSILLIRITFLERRTFEKGKLRV